MKKLKKIGFTICTVILTIYSKVYAVLLDPNKYNGEIQSAYGVYVYVPTAGERILYILKIVAIPIVLLIGTIIYLIKSKRDRKEKIWVVGWILFITCIVYGILFWIELLINQ